MIKNNNKIIYFLSKNGRWMKKFFDDKNKSKTVFVSKEEINNIPDKTIKNETKKMKDLLLVNNNKNNNKFIFKTTNSKLKSIKSNNNFLKQFRY